MRRIWGSLAKALALTFALAFTSAVAAAQAAAAEAAPAGAEQVTGSFTLPGYYALNFYPMWQPSDLTPWYVLKKPSWADSRLLKWGYIAVTHDGKRYYCLIQNTPPTGTLIGKRTYLCGDPTTTEMLYNINWKPQILIYGSPP
jgi:hypothetical protein